MAGPWTSTLRRIAEETNALPFTRVIAAVALKIIDASQEVQTNKEQCQRLASRAEQIVLVLARSQSEQEVENDPQLEEDLRGLQTVMEDILRFLESERGSGLVSRAIRTSQTSSSLKKFDQRLEDAFQSFQMRSNVSVRQSQAKMLNRLKDIYETLETANPVSTASSEKSSFIQVGLIPEGIYQIVNVASRAALEATKDREVMQVPQLECRSRRQLWAITKVLRDDNHYWIRSLFHGLGLEAKDEKENRTARTWRFHGTPGRMHWEILAKNGGTGETTYKLRTRLDGSFLDSTCKKSRACSFLHTHPETDLPSQEWNLVLVKPRLLIPPTVDYKGHEGHDALFIQNRQTKSFLSVQDLHFSVSVIAQEEPSAGSAWSFIYTQWPGQSKIFALVSMQLGSVLEQRNVDTLSTAGALIEDDRQRWDIVPYGDACVIIRNTSTQRLLCHRLQGGVSEVDTVRPTEFENPMCHWSITNTPRKGRLPSFSLAYDSTLSLVSPAITLQDVFAPDPTLPPTQRTGNHGFELLDPKTMNELSQVASREEILILRLASQGYNSFVVGVQEVDAGAKDAWDRVHSMDPLDALCKQYKGETCEGRSAYYIVGPYTTLQM